MARDGTVARAETDDGDQAVITVEGVEKRYGNTVALAGVSLSVEHGEVYGLIGPNGAGKTTLVRAVTGTTTPDAGVVRILETAPTAVDRNRVAVLPQNFAPPARLTAAELLEYYAGLYDDPRDSRGVLADVGLTDAADTWYEHLSGGQQRRVCVGAALVNDPEVLVVDEPTTGIDPAGRRTVWGLLEALAAGGTTILLTTHDMAEAERLADRVGLLAGGELVASGPPARLVAEHGGSNRLVVSLDGDDTEPTAVDTLETAGYTVSTGRGSVTVADVAPTDIGDVVAHLESVAVDYAGLEWTQPGLEDVYLALASDVERDHRRLATQQSRSLEELADGGRPEDRGDGGGGGGDEVVTGSNSTDRHDGGDRPQ